MWKQISRSGFLVKANARNFLSDAYKCSDAWQARLDTQILKQIKPLNFYYDLERKFREHGQVCAVDIDIFANRLNDNSMLDELADMVHKLRLTPETSNALDSMSHAVVRHHLDFADDNLTHLISVLDDRLSYGIFLDTFTANLTLDKLIKLKDYRQAAKVASLLMLQESFDNAINRTMSLYACYKYLENPMPFDEPVKEDVIDLQILKEAIDPKAKKAKGKKKDKVEEIRVRVNYLRNDYFDDHFDLRNSQHLVGKTFLSIARHLDGVIGNSIRLLGYCFYQKYEDGCAFLKSLENSTEFHQDAVKIAKDQLAQITDRQNDEHFKNFATQVDRLAESKLSAQPTSLEDAIHKLAEDAVSKYESYEIDEQKKIYELWCQIRETRLKEELERVNRFERVSEMERMTKEMAEQEEKLWFFENEEKIDLQIEEAPEVKQKTERKVKGLQRKLDESYVPPEVGVKRKN